MRRSCGRWPRPSPPRTSPRASASGPACAASRRIPAVLVAEHDGSLVGYVHVLVHEAFHADGMIGWVEELMVGEDQRGTGCGRALMAAA
ncbi:MAG: GNAT family N-acetyltransferase [Brachybacterium tyrofermentans]